MKLNFGLLGLCLAGGIANHGPKPEPEPVKAMEPTVLCDVKENKFRIELPIWRRKYNLVNTWTELTLLADS